MVGKIVAGSLVIAFVAGFGRAEASPFEAGRSVEFAPLLQAQYYGDEGRFERRMEKDRFNERRRMYRRYEKDRYNEQFRRFRRYEKDRYDYGY